MITHQELGNSAFSRSRQLKTMLNQRQITLAGNSNLRIYGLITCTSGKRMKIANRVFFTNEQEALNAGYRPCGHCMRSNYCAWKAAKPAM